MLYDDLPIMVQDCALHAFKSGVYETLTKRDVLLWVNSANGSMTRAVLDNDKEAVERWIGELLVHLIDLAFISGTNIEDCLRKRIIERDKNINAHTIPDEEWFD